MRRPHRFLVWLTLSALAAGGCPRNAELESQLNAPLDQTVGGASLAGDNAVTSADPFNARLAEEFPQCNEPGNVEELRQVIFRLVNEARAREGLAPVTQNDTLEQQATQYACELISYDFFAHQNPVTGSTLGDRAREFGYDFLVVGENLAAGQPTPERAFTDWMNSPSHRENIMDPRFTELGVGIRMGGGYGIYWVQEFGLPVESRGLRTPTIPTGP